MLSGAGGPLATTRPGSPDSYTPKHLAEKILTSRAALEGERKQVTVLFADLKGSMELLADRDPEEARKLLDPVLEHMMEAVHRYEGTVNQVMGDGIMALFGAPLAHEDHAVRACYAALRMQQAVKRYAEGVRRESGVTIRIRVGLNSGEVVVRAIGSDLHMDYTAVGQTTHLAARMEQLADPGAILVASETATLAEGFVQLAALGPVAVKGLNAPVHVYELTGASEVRSRLRAAASRGLSRFVGRDAEVDHIRRALDHAWQGHGQVAAIVGEPGVGKSRLLFELTHSRRVEGWLVLEAGSVSYGRATSYLPVIDVLRAYFRVGERDSRRDVREKVVGKLLALDRTLEPALPALFALLDVPADDGEWQALDPPQRRQRTVDAVKRLLLREAQVQPVLLVVEDRHWIDSETQALLDTLVDSLPSVRALLLVNYRPEYRHGWGGKTFYTQLRLDALPPAGAGELLDALLGLDPSVEPLKRLLREVTGGNPLFIEESVRTLVETGALLGERGAHRLGRAIETIQVPATVQAILAARIDRLAPEQKRLLETAAVIGMDFSFALLRAIADESEDALREGLGHLQSAEFLYETALFPDLEYGFKHALTHEVAYGNLLHERRRALHGQIVDAIEQLNAGRTAEHVERLAEHARRGEVWPKAARYLPQAGAKAAARGSAREAAAHMEQALVALAHLPSSRDTAEQAIDLRIELRNNLLVRRETAPALERITEAEAGARALGDRQRLARALAHKAHSLWLSARYPEGIQAGREALALACEVQEAPIVVAAAQYLGQVYRTVGQYPEAMALFRQNVAALQGPVANERFGMHALPSVLARGFLADCLSSIGEFAEAIALAGEAVQIAESAGHPFSIVSGLALRGIVHVRKGDFEISAPILERGLQLAHASDIRSWDAPIVAGLALAYRASGRSADAEPLLDSMGDISTSAVTTWGADLGHALLACQRLGEATAAANRSFNLSTEIGQPFHTWVPRVLAEIASAEDPTDTGKATAYYLDAIQRGTTAGLRPQVAHCHLGLGKLYRRTGKHEQAREHLTNAATMYREMGMTYWLEKSAAEMAEVG
jgi:class 3 adenylate cyclase/tetratricopeptide (TPR) repeat protein